ncbi:f55fbc6b-76c6-46fa-ae30-3b27f2399357-CDS [Sclerotinia trifoliorum]|uniref:F55fbc6b-76c6-46fa-ae30-3b27f2399357-CDS n=1 Tax=Sclerotinia trifoliorum TaxID=28548 RepID=A0A8H2VSW6_9HELO|nr:f55fbc6b-76c6-46fa-ae30-3b27f2399357-CDS [Sclerotinia trifoliorum]
MVLASAKLSKMALIHKLSILVLLMANARIPYYIFKISLSSTRTSTTFPCLTFQHTDQILIYIIAMAKWLNDGRTASALDHQFRPIKAAAKNASCNSPSSFSIALRASSVKFYPYFITSYHPSIATTHPYRNILLTSFSHRRKIR